MLHSDDNSGAYGEDLQCVAGRAPSWAERNLVRQNVTRRQLRGSAKHDMIHTLVDELRKARGALNITVLVPKFLTRNINNSKKNKKNKTLMVPDKGKKKENIFPSKYMFRYLKKRKKKHQRGRNRR